ncbi:response regulator [Halomicrobium salinisoli]|uniref:response regulator n=1 Tax=Halomicrobium salinisoli TaxID=2878391 RepID=UPI001CF0BC86|nr:response regulator [Halomicrobium salinisoli]
MSASVHQQQSDEPVEILLAEDNPGDVRLLREAFEVTGIETTFHVVNTGEAAEDFLKGQGDYEGSSLPDIVLLDLNLPRKDGYDVLETIRDDDRLQYLPVLILTSSSAEEDIQRCYAADANAYLTKPTGMDDFRDVVRAVERFWLKQARLPSVTR